jgi:hypothetical protein
MFLEGLGGGGRGGEGGSPLDMFLGGTAICSESRELGDFLGAVSLLRMFLTGVRFSLETAILIYLLSSLDSSSYLPRRTEKMFLRLSKLQVKLKS